MQVNDLGIVQNMGNFFRYRHVFRDIKKTKHIDILALGGSITAGGTYIILYQQHIFLTSTLFFDEQPIFLGSERLDQCDIGLHVFVNVHSTIASCFQGILWSLNGISRSEVISQ